MLISTGGESMENDFGDTYCLIVQPSAYLPHIHHYTTPSIPIEYVFAIFPAIYHYVFSLGQ